MLSPSASLRSLFPRLPFLVLSLLQSIFIVVVDAELAELTAQLLRGPSSGVEKKQGSSALALVDEDADEVFVFC